MNYNYKYINLTFKVYNDGVNSSIIEAAAELLVDIAKLVIFVKINIPQDANDKKYGREFFKASVDLQKLFNGIQLDFSTFAKLKKAIICDCEEKSKFATN